MAKQKGQVLLILLLVMAVGLGVGISVIQRSVSDVSTAGKVEESSRAFSAAEAGIEKALQGTCTGDPCVSFNNNSAASIIGGGLLPAQPGQALEYPPISKESIAQFWLADPQNPGTTLGSNDYAQGSIELYWGAYNAADKPAIEVTPIFWDGVKFTSVTGGTNYKRFFDQQTRTPANGFSNPSNDAGINCSPPAGGHLTGLAGGAGFQCKKTMSLPSGTNAVKMLRARLLYNSTDQPIAIKPISTAPCNISPLPNSCAIPPQARIITSTGSAGSTQRTVQLFTEDKVVPFLLDYAIFSAADINK